MFIYRGLLIFIGNIDLESWAWGNTPSALGWFVDDVFIMLFLLPELFGLIMIMRRRKVKIDYVQHRTFSDIEATLNLASTMMKNKINNMVSKQLELKKVSDEI